MSTPRGLSELHELDWLVDARHQIQLLMLELYKRWNGLESGRRELAAGAAFSLWRAVVLLAAEEANPPLPVSGRAFEKDRADRFAREALFQMVRSNAVGFSEETRHAHWTAPYYIDNAMYRIAQMRGASSVGMTPGNRNLAAAWNDALAYLQQFAGVAGGDVPVQNR